jgi:hypothetical protein
MDLCLNSCLNLVAIGRKRYAKIDATRFLTGKNKHDYVGNIQCAMSQDLMNSVVSFIKEKRMNEGECHMTRLIHSLTNNDLHGEEKGDVDLPSNTSKRKMYEQY